MLLIAATTIFSSFALTSCGDEDDDILIEYTLAIKAVRGSLSEAEYVILSQLNNETTVQAASDSSAKAILETAFNRSELTEIVNRLASTINKKDFGFDITLKRKSNGKLIHKIGIRPTI